MPEPVVSVVISTYDRPRHLAALLAGLRAQSLAASQFEVVVVDNGSGPGTAEILDAERARGELQLSTVRNEVTRGPAGGRNAGWPLARAQLVAFTDDDCVPAPGWLSAAVEIHRRNPGAIIQGRTEPDPAERAQQSLFSHSVLVTQLGPQFETCNIFYPKAVLEQLGGFDESFGLRPAGEDTDLAWRAIERGHRPEFAPDALVHHAVERIGMLGMLRLAARWGPCVRVFAQHPQTRTMLYRRVFWNVWHYLLCRSVLVLWAPRWLRRLVLVRYMIVLRARGRQAGAGSWSIPFLLLHDLVETWAVARGAVRYRTMVL